MYGGFTSRIISQPENILLFSKLNADDHGFNRTSHHRFVLIINFEGGADVSRDDVIIQFQSGKAIIIFPFQNHYCLNFAKKNICWLYITFELAHPKDISGLKNTLSVQTEALLTYTRELLALNLRVMRDQAKVTFLVQLLIEECKTGLMTPDALSRNTDSGLFEINAIQNFIYLNLSNKLKIIDIADELNWSESYVRAFFKKKTGVSLGQYIHRTKLLKASGLIASSKKRITEIARLCGFDSLYIFSRAFKLVVGVSPVQYRSKMLK